MPRIRRTVGATTGFLALALLLTAAAAQEPAAPQDKPEAKPKVKKAAPPAEKEGPASTTMYLFLRTGPDEDEAEVRINLKKALTASGAKYVGEPKLKPVSPTFYDELAGLAEQAGPAAGVAGATDLAVRRLPAQGAVYELTLDPAQVLKKLTVRYKSGGPAKAYVPEAPKAGDEKKPPLVLIVPGRYAFTPEAGDTPADYDAEVAQFGKPDETKTAPWPATDKHFVVTLQKFVGNRELLFDKLRDPDVVPNPFNVKRADDLLFAFASLNSTADDTGDDAVGVDNVTIAAENLKSSRVKRVWAYYPLDEAGMKDAVAKFRDPKMTSEALSQEVRKNQVKAGAAASLKADDGPKWYELTLPEDNPRGRFSRTIKVENLFDLAAKYRMIGKLIVWEFDDGTNPPAAIRTQHPKAEAGKVFALDRFDASWQANVKQARDRDGKK